MLQILRYNSFTFNGLTYKLWCWRKVRNAMWLQLVWEAIHNY